MTISVSDITTSLLDREFDDHIVGGDDDDRLRGAFVGATDELIEGGDGDDTLNGGAGDDALLGGAGGDRLTGASGRDLLDGGAGDDHVNGVSGDDVVLGGAGDDRVEGGFGDDLLVGGDGEDRLNGGIGTDVIFGGAGGDVFVYTTGGEVIGVTHSIPPSFIFSQSSGIDVIADFDPAVDTLDLLKTPLTSFEDLLAIASDTAAGMQIVFSETDVIELIGVSVSDISAANVRLSPAPGSSIDLSPVAENAIDLEGAGPAQTPAKQGGAGDDRLQGDEGDDRLAGGDGADRLDGDEGDDRLNGGDGDDVLFGEEGFDILFGGAGADTFIYSRGGLEVSEVGVRPTGSSGVDVILDFDASEDRLDLSETSMTTFEQFLAAARDTDYGMQVFFGGQDVLKLKGVSVADFGEEDVIFDELQEGPAIVNFGETSTFGGDEADVLRGGVLRDVFSGEGGDDILLGRQGADRLTGGDGDDRVNGGDDDDTLSGGAGFDILRGGDGDDILIGNQGLDILVGGAGADRFLLSGRDSSLPFDVEVIRDFDLSEDLIELQGFEFGGFSDLLALARDTTFGMQFDFGEGQILKLVGVSTDDLEASHFELN